MALHRVTVKATVEMTVLVHADDLSDAAEAAQDAAHAALNDARYGVHRAVDITVDDVEATAGDVHRLSMSEVRDLADEARA